MGTVAPAQMGHFSTMGRAVLALLCVLAATVSAFDDKWPPQMQKLLSEADGLLQKYLASQKGDGVGDLRTLGKSLKKFEKVNKEYNSHLGDDHKAMMWDELAYGYKKLNQDPKALPHMRRILDHKSCDGACKRISLAECMLMMRRMGLIDEAQALFDSHKSLVGASDSKQGNAEWVHSWQFPQWFDPTVRAKPVWDTEEFPAAVAMRDNYEAIRAEFEQILEDHEDEFLLDGDFDLVNKAFGWTEWKLQENGKWDEKRCKLVPKTCNALKRQPSVSGKNVKMNAGGPGQVTFLRLEAGAVLAPHCGPKNTRLTAHLGLIVPRYPEPASLRIGKPAEDGSDRHTWEEGKVIVFDDSYLHEAKNPANDAGYVLYASMWHPDFDSKPLLPPPDFAQSGGFKKEL